MIPIIIILTILLIVFITLYIRERRKNNLLIETQEKLINEIDKFIKNPKQASFSFEDNQAASLINKVAELEEQYLNMLQNIENERQRNYKFIADVSHQLKTPLSGLRLYVELSDSNYQEKELNLIERMDKMIQQLLRLEKLRAGAYELNFADTRLSGVIRNAWSELKEIYPDRKLIINGDFSVRVDRFWLKEAFQNILKNSCEQDYFKPEILVDIIPYENAIIVNFQDFAGGVRNMDIDELFTRFNRSAYEQNSKNSGLGLAITKTIIDLHHGNIHAQNTEHGLLISIYLPIISGSMTY